MTDLLSGHYNYKVKIITSSPVMYHTIIIALRKCDSRMNLISYAQEQLPPQPPSATPPFSETALRCLLASDTPELMRLYL